MGQPPKIHIKETSGDIGLFRLKTKFLSQERDYSQKGLGKGCLKVQMTRGLVEV